MTIDRTELERLIAARPPGPRTAMQGIRDNYADIERMRERGCSWAEISEILARLGVVSRDGSPIFVVTLRSAFFLVGIELRNGGPKGGAVTGFESRDDEDRSQETKSTSAPPTPADSAPAARLGGEEPAQAGEAITPVERVDGMTFVTAAVGSAVVETAVVETAVVETAVVETAVVETAVVETVAVKTAVVESTAVESTAVETAPVEPMPARPAADDNGMPETPPRVTAAVALSWDWTSRRGGGV